MYKNYERCTHCNNRRKWFTSSCLRKWLKPNECKHLQRSLDSSKDTSYLTEHKPLAPSVFIKFWKYKLPFTGSKRSSLRSFSNKNSDGDLHCSSSNDASPFEKLSGSTVTESKKDVEAKERLKKQKLKCQHSEGHSVLRGHHQHASLETCAIYCNLSKHGWYWGGISSSEAEELLAGQHDNVFLVRDSYDSKHILCVSFRCVGRTLHARLLHSNGLFSFNNETFVPANRISEHCSAVYVKSELFEMPVKLARPLNRFARLNSLQMICRFVIRQTVAPSVWNKLPLPHDLITYVSRGSDYIVPS